MSTNIHPAALHMYIIVQVGLHKKYLQQLNLQLLSKRPTITTTSTSH
jgi:hypothetical protein